MTPEDLEVVGKAGITAFLAAMDGNTGAVADTITHVGSTYGHHGVYVMCCGLASVVQQIAYPNIDPAGGDFAMVEMLEGFDLTNQGDLFAARFVTCTLNDDGATRAALFFAPINADDQEQTISNVVSLVGLAASLGNLRRAGKV